MACYHPAKAVRLQNGDVKFVSQSVVDGNLLTLPCGQCVGCRLEYSRQWAIRILDEAQMHVDNSFITLTLNPESVKKFGRSLDKSLFQKFMKRVRKEVAPLRTRFFIVESILRRLIRITMRFCLVCILKIVSIFVRVSLVFRFMFRSS